MFYFFLTYFVFLISFIFYYHLGFRRKLSFMFVFNVFCCVFMLFQLKLLEEMVGRRCLLDYLMSQEVALFPWILFAIVFRSSLVWRGIGIELCILLIYFFNVIYQLLQIYRSQKAAYLCLLSGYMPNQLNLRWYVLSVNPGSWLLSVSLLFFLVFLSGRKKKKKVIVLY